VSSQPRPGDVRLVVHAEPGAALGCIDVQLGFGRGSAGPGQPADHARYVATLYRMAAHLVTYCDGYVAALLEDCEPGAFEALQVIMSHAGYLDAGEAVSELDA
jgi:hypothetical protein